MSAEQIESYTTSFSSYLLGSDDDGVALHAHVQLLGLVLPALQRDLELVVVVLHLGMRKALVLVGHVTTVDVAASGAEELAFGEINLSLI